MHVCVKMPIYECICAFLRVELVYARVWFCAFVSLCDCVWVMSACRPVCVKRKSPIQCPVCVWERGSTLSHSAGGKLLSLSFGGGTICIFCILHSLFSPATWEAEQRLAVPRAQRKSVKTQPKAAACLQAQRWATAEGAVQWRLSRAVILWTSVIEEECRSPVIGYSLWFASI